VKSWDTVRAIVNVELGAPVTSCELTMMLYVPGAALLGTLIVASTGTEASALIVIGFDGVSVHCAAGSAVALQVALTWPL
jgi:hypothetical protein